MLVTLFEKVIDDLEHSLSHVLMIGPQLLDSSHQSMLRIQEQNDRMTTLRLARRRLQCLVHACHLPRNASKLPQGEMLHSL